MTPEIEVHLVRHGETQSYFADVGLTDQGAAQSRERGRRLAREVVDGERVRLLWAPTVRALETARHLGAGLQEGLAGRRVTLGEPEPAPDFRNFDVWTPSGPREPTQAHADFRQAPRAEQPGSQTWLLEMDRFWALKAASGDPIAFWLRVPLLTFEPPAEVVRRLWGGLQRLAGQAAGATRVVCCTHSGPMRALAAAVLGEDVGEPDFGEDLRLRLQPARDRAPATAVLTYRGAERRAIVPTGEATGGHDEGETR